MPTGADTTDTNAKCEGQCEEFDRHFDEEWDVQYVCHYDAVIPVHIFNSLAYWAYWYLRALEQLRLQVRLGMGRLHGEFSILDCHTTLDSSVHWKSLKHKVTIDESLLFQVYCVMLCHVVCHMEFIFASAWATETGAPTLQLVQHILPNKVKALVQDGPSSFLMMSRYIKALNPNESDWTCTSKAIM